MDVHVVIQYSEDRLCVVTAARPADGEAIYRVVGRREDISGSLAETGARGAAALRAAPWPGRRD